MELESISLSNEDVLIKIEKNIHVIQSCLLQLKRNIESVKFNSQADEINFFKSVKPTIVAKLIFQVKLFNIESRRVARTEDAQVEYLENTIAKMLFGNSRCITHARTNLNAEELEKGYGTSKGSFSIKRII